MNVISMNCERQRIPAMATIGPRMIESIGIRELIDEHADNGKKVISAGTAVKIISGPLFCGNEKPALMNYGDFYVDSPTELMFGPKVHPSNINATALSRSLDLLYELNRDEITWKCHELCEEHFDLESFLLFLDETNFPFHGEVPENVPDGCPVPAFGGNSKTKQNNIPQYDVLGVSNSLGEIVFTKPYSGNTSDKKMNEDTINFLASKVDPSLHTITADSKLIDQNLIALLLQKNFGFVGKVPINYSEKLSVRVRELAKGNMKESSRKGLLTFETDIDTVNGRLRAVAFEFPVKIQKSAKRIVAKAKERLDTLIQRISKTVYPSKEEAQKAVSDGLESVSPLPFEITCDFRRTEFEEKWGKRGRPPKSWVPGMVDGWTAEMIYAEIPGMAERIAEDQGIQVLITNLPSRDPSEEIPDGYNPRSGATAEEIVKIYLMEYNVEWIFRLMKSGAGIDTVYLHTPERECAMIFVISIISMVMNAIDAALKKWYGNNCRTVARTAIDTQRITVEYSKEENTAYLIGDREKRAVFENLLRDLGISIEDLLSSN